MACTNVWRDKMEIVSHNPENRFGQKFRNDLQITLLAPRLGRSMHSRTSRCVLVNCM